MTLYADTSALLKRYVDEPDSERAVELLVSDPELVTGRHTEQTAVRTLDALHLGAAQRLGTAMTFLTFDVRQAQAARALGFAVAGA